MLYKGTSELITAGAVRLIIVHDTITWLWMLITMRYWQHGLVTLSPAVTISL